MILIVSELILIELIVMGCTQLAFWVLGTEERRPHTPLLERMYCLLKGSKDKHAFNLELNRDSSSKEQKQRERNSLFDKVVGHPFRIGNLDGP